jgi:hypothetical protein
MMGNHLEGRLEDKALPIPFLLRVAMLLGALFGVVGTSAGLVGLGVAVFGEGPVTLGGDPVPRSHFLPIAVPFLLLYVAACLTAGAASWSLWKRHRRARLLLTVLLVEFVVGDTAMLVLARRFSAVPAAEVAISAAFFVGLVAIALWYLFRSRSVVAFFESCSEPSAN